MSGKYKNYINMQTRFTFTTLYLDYFAPIISSLFLYFSICCFNFLLLRHMQGGLYFGIWTQPRAKSRDLQFIQFSYLLFFFRFFLVTDFLLFLPFFKLPHQHLCSWLETFAHKSATKSRLDHNGNVRRKKLDTRVCTRIEW